MFLPHPEVVSLYVVLACIVLILEEILSSPELLSGKLLFVEHCHVNLAATIILDS
jgi:hypothetical protein